MTTEAIAVPDRRAAPVEVVRRRRLDPRLYQIGVLSGLLLYGALGLGLGLEPATCLVILATALASQYLLGRAVGLPRFDPRSPLISSLSLCLLLRTGSLPLAALAALVTIGGKFAIRVRGKHLFNPTNFGLVVMMLATDRAWVSPGQWGSAAFFGFLLACLGGLVVNRAARSDVTWAFLAAYVGLLLARALWLGDPLAIPLHQLQSGAFLIFTFFMISDPKTTPDSRAGRVLFAALVAGVAFGIRFGLYEPNGLLWALAACAPLVPVIDRLLPGRQYRWPGTPLPPAGRARPFAIRSRQRKETAMKPRATLLGLLPLLILLAAAPPARAFCGFYVARADTRLFNRASQVVLVRDRDRTVLTMANDFQGEPTEFALVVPVPTFIEREQIHVADKALIDHLDAYSAPRLVEYFDPNPCQARWLEDRAVTEALPSPASAKARAQSLGVTIEASYTVGEYDILILSAEQSQGLLTWLRENGYRLPKGAEPVLGSYLKQGMRFFVARVNLEQQAKLGFTYLRPLQVAYETPKFMLPIRLGMVNAEGPQELYVYTLTRTGRVETTNYRTVRLPSGMDLPVFLKDPEEFTRFYREMFARQVEQENGRAVFLEYAWDMGWCDPCAADPLSRRELQELGVFWLGGGGPYERPPVQPGPRPRPRPVPPTPAQDVYVSRLHLRYDNAHFPEDLFFQETGDRSNFQGRYVLRHAWQGDDRCPEAERYHQDLARRREEEAQTLARLTGWEIDDVRRKMSLPGEPPEKEPWWKRIWGEGR